MSTLFFVDDRVYKRKKPLDLGFVDFRAREARRLACHEEVRLNRRLSPDVYLGVSDVLDVDGQVCEHLVVMRRMPDSTRLAALVQGGADVSAALRDIARQIASLHASAPAPARLLEVGSPDGVRRLWVEGLDAVASFPELVAPDVVGRTRELALRWLEGRGGLLVRRLAEGRVCDGHGDLLADDVFVLADGPRLLDCLEFDERLRIGDGLSDAAFLAMDLERLGSPAAAGAFLTAYRESAHDDAPAGLVDHYLAYRAHIRCKVACLRDDGPSARAHADLALAHLERSEVRLVLVGGLPGSGKTTLAAELARRHGWVHMSSDVTRKALHDGTGVYTPTATARTYDAMLDQARERLSEGQSVVLDASFTDASHRAAARALARELSARPVELQCVVADALADARIRDRRDSPSEATPEVRALLNARRAPWPEATDVDTAADHAVVLALADALTCPAEHPSALVTLW